MPSHGRSCCIGNPPKGFQKTEGSFELIPELKKLGYAGVDIDGYGCYGGSQLLFGAIAMARVQAGGQSIRMLCSIA